MRLDVDLECDSHFQAEGDHITVIPFFNSRTNAQERDIKGLPSSRIQHLKCSGINFKVLSLFDSPIPRRRSVPSKFPRVNVGDKLVPRRGSVYQSSSEVSRMSKLKEGKWKESTYSSEAFLSFNMVNSSTQNRQDDTIFFSQRKEPSLGSLDAKPKYPPVETARSISRKTTELLDLSFRNLSGKELNLSNLCSSGLLIASTSTEILLEASVITNAHKIPFDKEAAGMEYRESTEEEKLIHSQIISTENDENLVCGRDTMRTLPKSFSAKVGMFSSSCTSEKETPKASSKSRFNHLKRMLDPIMKSKSMRNQSLMAEEPSGSTTADPATISSNGPSCKSLLNDFSKAATKLERDKQLTVSDQGSIKDFSPAHLHAILKLVYNNNAPSFEFSIKDLEDVLSAKIWMTDSALNWAYTFHRSKRKNTRSGRGTKDRHGQYQLVAQMQVSCFLCSEGGENGSLDNYMVTEFVLYDTANVTRNFAAEERSHCPPNFIRTPGVTIPERLGTDCMETNSSMDNQKHKITGRQNFVDCDSDPLNSYPWSPLDLQPHLEIAAIEIQIPLKNENLKESHVNEINTNYHKKVTSVSLCDHGRDRNYSHPGLTVVNVVTPNGTHGLPSNEEGGPSSLLDRWRFHGGCDCGGWDMACPIVVFGYACVDDLVGYSTMRSEAPKILFSQGSGQKIPELSIGTDGKGQYSVDFHARLSALQAFSICIAVLHSSEASAFGHERKAKNEVELISSSFLLDAPYSSPMGRG